MIAWKIPHATWLVTLVLLAACGGGTRDVVEPPPTDREVVLTIKPDPLEASTAQKLGWGNGIPGAEVTVTPVGGGEARTFTSSASGTVTIPSLNAGKYRVAVRRLLTAAEIATLNEASGAGAFTGESEVEVTADARTATVEVPASFRTSLVISEWSFQHKLIPGTGLYYYGGFLELYNNSDTTIYLDGILIADGHTKAVHVPGGFANCDLYEPYQNDPQGIWTRFIAAFPGSGREYPLAPGREVVIATDAIDHRTAGDDLLDLRNADFEFMGGADVDNPGVPNMIDRGLSDYFFGHGFTFMYSLGAVATIALPNSPDVPYTRQQLPPQATEHLRLPRERLLDVFTSLSTWMSLQQPPNAVCPELVHASMDRKYAVLLAEEPNQHLVSISRKVLRTLPDGRHVLQSTRSSANDFHRTPLNPGVILAP